MEHMNDDIDPPVYEIREKPEVPAYVDKMSGALATLIVLAIAFVIISGLVALGMNMLS